MSEHTFEILMFTFFTIVVLVVGAGMYVSGRQTHDMQIACLASGKSIVEKSCVKVSQ